MSNGIYFFLSKCIKYIYTTTAFKIENRTSSIYLLFLLMMCRWRHEDGTSLELSLEKIKYSVYAELKSLLEDRAHNFHGCIEVSWPCCKKCKIMAKIGQEKQDRGGNCTNQSMAGWGGCISSIWSAVMLPGASNITVILRQVLS